jgi:hypothetical protein
MINKTAFITILVILLTWPAGRAAEGETAPPDEKAAAYMKVDRFVTENAPSGFVLAPEGQFVAAFNDEVAAWIGGKIDRQLMEKIKKALAPRLEIELNKQGFASAASREAGGGQDETNYDAIWVRDNVWIYYSLLADPARKADARRLILALWDYYATDAQVARFKNIIQSPGLALDQMAVPHIRFDSRSPDFSDVMVAGKPEAWNHRQIDAHGIFFTALGEAFENGLLKPKDLDKKRFLVLSLYPLFLDKIGFENYEDAGAWEEIPRINTSSIALATRSLQVWKNLLYRENRPPLKDIREKFGAMIKKAKPSGPVGRAWTEDAMDSLIGMGMRRVKYQLELGGESPDYPPDDVHFRLADMALVFVIRPSALEGLSEEEFRKILLITEALRRPCGYIRYVNDSYQSGNYWIQKPEEDLKDKPALTGDTSSKEAFLWRLGRLIPDTEAQWFFDSILCSARLYLAGKTADPKKRRDDIHAATVHLKRALGQITGGSIASDGNPVREWQTPESINTVVIDGKKACLPSPITPLNWAKAALAMALGEYESVVLEQPAPAGGI